MIVFKDQSPLQIFQQNIPSELLRKDGSSPLLKNFHKFLSLKKSEHDERQQDLYTAVLCRPERAIYEKNDTITLTRTSSELPPDHDDRRKSVLVWPGNQFGPDELNSIFSKKYCIKIIFAKASQNILM